METRKASIKRKLILIGVSAALALGVWGLNASYAWYAHSDIDNDIGYMGEVIVGSGEELTVGKDGSASFNISNDSTIDIYFRLGWTPICKSGDKELTEYTKNIKLNNAYLTMENGLSEAKLSNGNIESLNGYVKRMLTLEDEEGNYFVLPAGTDVNVNIAVADYTQITEALAGGEHNPAANLYIVVVPEAIQATKAAVAEASEYGWDTDKVVAQAGTIAVTGPVGGDGNEAD